MKMKFVMLIKVKMPKIVGILTIISNDKYIMREFENKGSLYFFSISAFISSLISGLAELSMKKKSCGQGTNPNHRLS